ncbi:YqjD family protein [Herminiimonas sp. CN]|uniref:DUF883 family protein n=1 Tax=Herminiimonas sp. CN TaxID=1349818 RepID=UPI0005500361|nr:DUF883 family protein [Herminiimonas sp. CN]
MNINEISTEGRDRIMGELKSVIKDAEEMMKNTEQQTGEGFKNARAKFESTLRNAKTELVHLEETIVERAKDAMHTTDEYVKDHPWKSVGLGACVGLIVGLLIGRK